MFVAEGVVETGTTILAEIRDKKRMDMQAGSEQVIYTDNICHKADL